MNDTIKSVEELTVNDLERHPVWSFTNSHESTSPGELAVKPIRRLPVKSLVGKIVGCPLTLNCGRSVMGFLGNIDLTNAALTEHFLTLSVFSDRNELFHLARYHDGDAQTHGPDALAKFLGLKVDEVFPIRYDIAPFAVGRTKCLRGAILSTPHKRLTRAEIIALAVP